LRDRTSTGVAMTLDAVPKGLDLASSFSAKGAKLDGTRWHSIQGPHHITLPLSRDAQKHAFTLEHVLSRHEAGALIQSAEAVGFQAAGLGGSSVVATQFRDSGRIIVDDAVLAQQIFSRIRPYLPIIFDGRRIVGLNEQLKFLRYHPGQKFVAHYDGCFCRPGTDNKTCLTLQLYLSGGDVVGGATRFMDSSGMQPVSCLPIMGRALIFQHNILHDGEEVREGVKYTIRTDVEYSGRSCLAQIQCLLGLGCSPVELRRRCLVVTALLTLVVAMAAAAAPGR